MPSCFGAKAAADEPDAPIVEHDDPHTDNPTSTTKSASDGGFTTTDDELDSRLSRRSSVLVDLLSLFRRSSSVLIRPNSTKIPGLDDDYEEDDEETRNISKERILEAIQHKKEIIGKLRSQPWNMKRKRRTLKVAQRHIQRQEAKVSKVRLYKAEATRRLTQFSRWFDNMKIYLIPWEAKIKGIESHFGSVVSSYFTFLRWVLNVNINMTLIMMLFVIIPEWLADSRMAIDSDRYNKTKSIKNMPDEIVAKADELSTVWDFGGYAQYSLIFYGYYSRETFFGETVKYKVPVAYFLANIAVLGYSFFIILRKMASNAKSSKMSSGKTEQYVFSWKTFTGWDYGIGNPETSTNIYRANVIKFREITAEFTVDMKKTYTFCQIFTRSIAFFAVIGMYCFSVWAISQAAKITKPQTFVEQNAVAIIVSFITIIFPCFFDLIGVTVERYHPRTALRIQLARVLVLYILNYYTLIVSLFVKLNQFKVAEGANIAETFLSINWDHPDNATTLQRTLRQIVDYVSTTPAPPTPWTTVLSDFGPIGISNPKAFVAKETITHNASVVVSQVIGPQQNWNDPEQYNISMPRQNYSFVEEVILPPIVNRTIVSEYGSNVCWETIIGQEITKLVNMDLLMTIASILVIDFFRGLACRYLNLWWPWNLETTFPEYGEFKVAENILHLVNNQGMIWLGLFFVPMLPMINNIKLIVIMYIRAWAAMTCNVPAKQIFRASRSSNFFLLLLLLFLFLCTLPVGYVIASRIPSSNCGPFRDQPRFYSVISDVLEENLNDSLVDLIKYIMSPGIVIPILLLMMLAIYFLFELVRGLREANTDLTTQLMHERTEEKKKIFELAGGRKGRKRFSIWGGGSFRKKEKPPAPAIRKQVSSDDDSTATHPRSVNSKSGKQFVPSLGSVSEVDHSEHNSEEEIIEEIARAVTPPKLSLKQKILCWIGWSEPKDYIAVRHDDEDVETGHRVPEIITDDRDRSSSRSKESSGSRGRPQMMPLIEVSSNRSRAQSNEKSEDGRKTRETSYRTASQSSSEQLKTATEGMDRSKSGTRSVSYRKDSDVDFSTPPSRQRTVEVGLLTPTMQHRPSSAQTFQEASSSHSGSSGSGTSGTSLPAVTEMDEPEVKRTAKRLLQPLSSQFNARYGHLADAGDPTRPPSVDGSLSDPSPIPNSEWYTSNPHSSYTSAMMSPIMNEILSTDEGTDDEKARLLPEKPPHPQSSLDSPATERHSRTTRPSKAPKFRISMSPPRKKAESDSEASTRRFEMKVRDSFDETEEDRHHRQRGEHRSRERTIQGERNEALEESPARRRSSREQEEESPRRRSSRDRYHHQHYIEKDPLMDSPNQISSSQGYHTNEALEDSSPTRVRTSRDRRYGERNEALEESPTRSRSSRERHQTQTTRQESPRRRSSRDPQHGRDNEGLEESPTRSRRHHRHDDQGNGGGAEDSPMTSSRKQTTV